MRRYLNGLSLLTFIAGVGCGSDSDSSTSSAGGAAGAAGSAGAAGVVGFGGSGGKSGTGATGGVGGALGGSGGSGAVSGSGGSGGAGVGGTGGASGGAGGTGAIAGSGGTGGASGGGGGTGGSGTLTATAIGAGSRHSCALLTNGAVKCWGGNINNQLGNGNAFVLELTPDSVSGLSAGVTAIAVGAEHGCATAAGGAAKCWGYNKEGQLGNGTTVTPLVPVPVSGLSSAAAGVGAGLEHSCAVTNAGAVKCWGANSRGQLGDSTTTDRHTPVNVAGLGSGVTSVAAGWSHTCALTKAGAAKCWGSNDRGELGSGTGFSKVPVDVVGLSSGVSDIALGDRHTCAVTVGGVVKCWGRNFEGQLGDGTKENRATPVKTAALSSGAVAVAAGSEHGCAVTSGGGVKCWGKNTHGQLGDGTQTDRLIPVSVSGLKSGVIAITAGAAHTCALTSTGSVMCWGSNWRGQLGDDSLKDRLTPVAVKL